MPGFTGGPLSRHPGRSRPRWTGRPRRRLLVEEAQLPQRMAFGTCPKWSLTVPAAPILWLFTVHSTSRQPTRWQPAILMP